MQWLLRDGLGHIARILFAWKEAKNLGSYAKSYRFLADVLNDAGLFFNILSGVYTEVRRCCGPIWSRDERLWSFCSLLPLLFDLQYYLPLSCTGTLCFSVVAVAGGATRTAIVEHQAKNNNISDVSAKDGSQETAVNLLGLLFSIIFIPYMTRSSFSTWLSFVFLTTFHLVFNYFAVKSVVMVRGNENNWERAPQRPGSLSSCSSDSRT